MKVKNPVYQKIIDFLQQESYPRSTKYIARYVVDKKKYDEDDAFFQGKALVQPGRDSVSRSYYFLSNLQKEGKIRQVGRGIWAI